VEYTVVISIDAQGSANVIVENADGSKYVSASSLQVGTGPFYLVLSQREGLPALPAGPNEAQWYDVSITGN
jgi:hypothetical protein